MMMIIIKLSDYEIMEKFEEIEDMLIFGKEHELYNITIKRKTL